MADWIFNGTTKIIKEPAGVGDATFDVTRDIYSAWKRWVQSGAGASFDVAITVEGGTPIGATGLFTGVTFLLVNGWKLQSADHDGQATIIGNIFSDDGVITANNPVSNRTIFASGTVGAQGVATGGVQQSTLENIQTLVDELHKLQGLDAANPMTVTRTSRATGSISQTISGDGETTTTVTRNP